MVDLDDQLLRDLARLRERSGPPIGAEQRVRMALDAAIGPGPDGGEDGGSASGDGNASSGGLGSAGLGGGGKLALVSKVIAVTLATTCLGLLLVNARPTPDRPNRPSTNVAAPGVAVAGAPRSDPPASTTGPDPEPEPPIVVTPGVTLGAKPSIPVQRTSAPEEEHLTAEVTLLEQARTIDDLTARLELLELHRTRFENGHLAAERESLRIATLCELDQLDTARRAAEEFLRAHPRSPLRLRMRSACPTLDVLTDE